MSKSQYFGMSYVWDIQITKILECHIHGISKSQIFVSGIFYGYPISIPVMGDILFPSGSETRTKCALALQTLYTGRQPGQQANFE